jgi:histidine triad (HIT) family protein
MPEQQLTEEQAELLQEKIKNMSPEELAEFQKSQCIFCQILNDKIPSKKVYEDNVCIATLDIAPASKGHLLLIPREHYAVMPQVPDQTLGHLIVIAKRLSQIMLKYLKVTGTNIFVANGAAAGQRVQHFFLHLIPRKEGDQVLDLNEKIIEKEMVTKVKTAVEGKLLDLLGIKKEKIKEKSMGEMNEEPKEKITKKTTKKQQKKGESDDADLDNIANLFK